MLLDVLRMTKKTLLVSISIVSLLFIYLTPVVAVDTRNIEAVRGKKVLDNSDLQAIDAFVVQSVAEILATEDFSTISSTRSIIIANSASTEPGQVQFAEQFSASAKKHIAAALEKADGLTPSARSFKVIVNLLMVLDGLADLRLVDLPLKYVDSDKVVIRYWAVHCLTNPQVIEKLNSAKEIDMVRKIAGRLDAAIATSNPETLGLIAAFGGSITASDGVGLLFKVADRRIASYADWSVQYELLDATILQILSDKMAPSNTDKAEAGRRFGQLLSYVFQRYIKGANQLKTTQKEQLASVLIETEKNCVNKLTGKPQMSIKRAIEAGDLNALLEEHNNLLGNATKPGQLPSALGFNYGKDNSGSPLMQPLQLADPPKS